MTYQEKVTEFNYCPPGKEIELVLWGLVGEFGEVAEKLKKHIRGGLELSDVPDMPQFKMELAKELGDVWWYFNIHCSRYGFEIEKSQASVYEALSLNTMVIDTLKGITEMWSNATVWNDPGNPIALMGFSFAFQGVCAKLGFEMDRIEKINLKKLKDRKRRGVIHGEGDER